MIRALLPSNDAIARVARAECDPAQAARFRPIAWGFAGNLVAVLIVGALGLVCAILLVPVRAFRPKG